MANAWYRLGTISVVNGSATVTGSGTLFLGNINPGDILLAPDGNDYEIKTVPSDEQLTIARKNGVASYAGTTQAGQPYAIIRTGPNNALLANQLSGLAAGWLLDRQQYAAWQGGVYNGGVNSDGKYPLTDAEGVTTLVLCPAALMSGLSSPIMPDRYQENTVPGTTDMTAAINTAIAAAISNGSNTVVFVGDYYTGALIDADKVVFVGYNASFQPGISYKINQSGAIAGKKNIKYSVYGAVPRNDDIAVTSITRSGTTATVTVASTSGLNTSNYVTVSGAAQSEYNQTAYPTNITPTSFDMLVAGSPATPATGSLRAHWWAMIDDAGHSPTGFASVTTPDIYTLRMNYDTNSGFGAKKISTLLVGADDALTPHGLIAGGDVGTSYANIKMAVPLACSFSGGAGNVPALIDIPPLLTGALSVGNSGAGTRTLTHPAVFAGDVPVVSVRASSLTISQPKQVQVEWTTTSVTVSAISPIAGYISWNGSAFVQALSDNITPPTLTWTSGTGVLRVAFQSLTNDTTVPMIAGFGGAYIPQVVSVGTDYFEISFFDFAGTKITGAAATGMKFNYQKTTGRTLAEWPADMVVTVRRGYVPVRTDDVWRVAGNNLWISGLMENY